MSEKFTVELISPEKSFLKADTTEVIIPSYEGEMGILKDHVSFITFLRPGIIYINSNIKKNFFAEEGIVEFSNNNLLILSSTAKELSSLDKNFLDKLKSDSEKKIKSEQLTDKEKYLLSYKISTINNINQ